LPWRVSTSCDVAPGKEVDLRKVCTDVAAHLAPLVVKEQRQIEVIGSSSPVIMLGNGAALEQAIRNLVENAIRYSAPGTTVTIEIRADGLVHIIDRGKWISRGIREKVFQRFKRADQTGGGAGLGLAIVKRTVEAHDGTVSIDDNPEGGTIFTLRFPAERVVSDPPLRLVHDAS
jgi:signal transduction histidine kinase